jgi:uncharacterized protein YcbX
LQGVPKNSAVIIAGVGIATALAYYYKKRSSNKIPTEWKEVGWLSEIFCFPVKSCGFVKKDSVDCSDVGVFDGIMRDRCFMVVRENREFVTGRTYPKLLKVKPTFENGKMILTAPEMERLTIDVLNMESNREVKTEVWGSPIDTVDVGDQAADWFSRYLLNKDFGMRLVYYPSMKSDRKLDVGLTNDPDFIAAGALHDDANFMLMNEASVDDLNSRLVDPITPLQFRGNFVVKGAKPFEEDAWDWIRIGEVIFRVYKPCTRFVIGLLGVS